MVDAMAISRPTELPSGVKIGREMRPVIAAANADDVMREQFDYIMEHVAAVGCGCRTCKKYLLLRKILLSTFK